MADAIVSGCGIYAIRNTANGKYYVGSSVDMSRRLRIHLWRLRRGDHHSRKLQAAWNKHGEHSFVFETLALCGENDLLPLEQGFLDRNKNGYNVAEVAGAPMAGKRHSKEAKAKISAAFLGVPKASPLVKKGEKLPAEWVRNASATHIGKKRSAAARANMAAAARGNKKWLGKAHSEESKQKMREARIRWHEERKAKSG